MRSSETNLGSSSPGGTQEPTKSGLSRHQVHAVLGILLGACVFVTGLVLDPVLSILSFRGWMLGQIDASFAYTALTLAVVGLCILFTSVTRILANRSSDETNENLTSVPRTISTIFSNGPYSRILLVSSVLYAVFYGLASGIVVFQPLLNFSAIYHRATPSISVATCCGAIGEYPVATVYLTEHLGLILIPLNLLFLFSISWLVGLNIALLSFTLKLRALEITHGWIGGLGAFVGLFTACPTCAGLALLSVMPGIGSVGGLSTILLLNPVRTAFVAASYPTLIVGSIVTAKTLGRIINSSCVTRLG